MLIHFTILELQRQNALSEVVWMQDDAPPYVGSSVKRLLNQRFGDIEYIPSFPISVATKIA